MILAEMGQKIGNVEHRIGGILTQNHVHRGAVLTDHGAVEGKRDGCPLILFDAAVVMGLEHGKTGIAVQGILL